MSTFLLIILIIAGIIVILLTVAFVSRKDHMVQREITINAPIQKVFDYIKLLENQDHFNKWAVADPDVKRKVKGIDGTVGFTIAWSGNKDAGEGEKEIVAVEPEKSMKSEMRFVKPMKLTSYTALSTEPVSSGFTKVTWTNSGTLPYPMNIMISMLEKKFPKEIDESLLKLKAILERQ